MPATQPRRPGPRPAVATVATLAVALAVLIAAFPAAIAAAASPQQDVEQADQLVVQASAALDAGDIEGARAAYQAFRERWHQIEDGVNATSADHYADIEAAMRDVRTALQPTPVNVALAREALQKLHAENQEFVELGSAPEPAEAAPGSADAAERLDKLLSRLDSARSALGRHDTAAALGAVRAFQKGWPAVEGLVKAKSPAVYTATENDMASAEALLRATPPRAAEADAVLAGMRDRLEPITESGSSYGVFDAFVIMLREGLEALLVVGALTAFLKKSGNADKQTWIWGGAGAGVVLSVGLALILQQLFSEVGAGLGSELVEGVVGLVAAAMLFYVSYWLHSKARLGAWQRYIHDKSSAALAGGSMLSLSLIALLAVFREGAETTVFYLGIAPSIAPRDLVLGLGLGVLALVLAGVVVLAIGLRLPLRPFFLVSSVLIYYLGFKFVGTGLHALQVAGVLRATPAPLPTSDLLGVYPTWETALPQLILLGLAAGVLWLSVRQQQMEPLPARG